MTVSPYNKQRSSAGTVERQIRLKMSSHRLKQPLSYSHCNKLIKPSQRLGCLLGDQRNNTTPATIIDPPELHRYVTRQWSPATSYSQIDICSVCDVTSRLQLRSQTSNSADVISIFMCFYHGSGTIFCVFSRLPHVYGLLVVIWRHP